MHSSKTVNTLNYYFLNILTNTHFSLFIQSIYLLPITVEKYELVLKIKLQKFAWSLNLEKMHLYILLIIKV